MKATYAWVAIVVLAIAAALGWGGYLNEISSTEDSDQVTAEIGSSPASEQVSMETAANIQKLAEQNKSLAAANESLMAENQALKNLNESLADAAESAAEQGESVAQNNTSVTDEESQMTENQTSRSQSVRPLDIMKLTTDEIFSLSDEEFAEVVRQAKNLYWSPTTDPTEAQQQSEGQASQSQSEEPLEIKKLTGDEILNLPDEQFEEIVRQAKKLYWAPSKDQTTTQPQGEEQVTGSDNTEMTEDATVAAVASASGETNEASQSTSSMALKVTEALVEENQNFRAVQNELEEVKSQLMESKERRVMLETKLSLLDQQNRQVVQSLGNVLDEQASAAPVLEDIARQLAEIDDEPAATVSEPEEVGDRVTEVIVHLQILRQERGDLEEQLSSAQNQLARSEQQNDYLAKRLEYASKHLRRIRFNMRSEKERNQGLSDALNEVQRKLSEDVAQLQTEITSLITGMSGIRLGTDILFASGSADLTAEGENALRIFSQELLNYRDAIISVEGHTDNKQIKPTISHKYPTNWELSAARATSAVRYLVELGVPAERVRAIGHGESKPANSNDTEQGRSKNRRIELVVHLPSNSSS